MKLELVKDWMARDVLTVSPESGVLAAGQLMREKGVRRLPVVDGHGRLVGIVTFGDVREAKPSAASTLSTWEMNYLLARLTVAEIMHKAPLTISPDATIGEAAYLMNKHKISGLPVCDAQNNLVGILTESDIFRLVAHDWLKAQEGPTPPYAHYEG